MDGELHSTFTDPRLKAYLRSPIEKVVVGPEKTRIFGNREALSALVSGYAPDAIPLRAFRSATKAGTSGQGNAA